MRQIIRPILLVLAISLFAALPAAAAQQELDLENTLYLDLKDGRVVIKLRPDLAPNTVARIKELARQGFYDGIVFHRVIDGFMAQTGDPTGTGGGGSDLPDLKAEFSKTAKHVRGTVSMARTNDPDSANSQFFIVFEPRPGWTASTPSSARWSKAWSMSTPSRRAPATTAACAIPTRSSACASRRM